ncbi:MAG: hypothetical protein K0R50_2004 [Eubacterium sp.]|jgi:hypothetical protein|nr:hypothetical protein [Eubacterium sp.]
MNGFYVFISIASIIAILVTFFLGRIFRNKPFIKYIPCIITALAGIGFYIKAAIFSTGFEDLAYLILVMIACVVFFLSFLTAFIMGIIQRKSKN